MTRSRKISAERKAAKTQNLDRVGGKNPFTATECRVTLRLKLAISVA